MHSPLTTRVLLGSALALSLLASISAALRPRPVVPPPGQVLVSTGSAVKVEARSSHPAVTPARTEFFHEYTVTLTGEAPAFERVSLAVVLDRSGSMSGSKIDEARRAVHRLVDLVQDGDELALVTFSSDAAGSAMVRIDAAARAKLHREIDAIEVSGGTNIQAGLQAGRTALTTATGARRLVLISDGQPTEGAIDTYSLTAQVAQTHAERITVTALGVGMDYDATLLSRLSERGGGMLGHLVNAEVLEEVLSKELAAARLATARNVELELETEGAVVVDVPGRTPFTRDGRTVVSLADLRPNVPTRVIVRLRSAASPGADAAVVRARVGWQELSGEAHASQLALASPVLDDDDEVNHRRDEPLFARGVTALGQLRVLAAADAYARGDDALGSSLLDQARSVFGMSADALAGDTSVQLRRELQGSDRETRRRRSLGLEKKTLENFGRENEGY
ncbi:MAG: VWA domain-containing protein [Myxococcaceae bacterium]